MWNNLILLLSAATVAIFSVLLLHGLDTTWWPRRTTAWADLVLRNATIYTSDPSLPFAEAMAVRGSRILRVGDYSSLRDVVGPGTHEINLNGKIIVPGFIDSHTHLLSGGLQMARVDLREVRSPEAFVNKIKRAAEDKDEGDWILGGGWNNDFWGGDLPAASWIDELAPKNPVWLSRMDGHMGLANSLALRIAGITNSTQDPIGGTVMKTAGGEPTGLLIDSAMELISPFIPEVSLHDKRDALMRATQYALMRGVTTVVDFGRYFPGVSVEHVWQDLTDVYQWADSSGLMRSRVCIFFPMQTWSRVVDLVREKGKHLSQWIYVGGVKAFADGSLGSSSALFYEPYIDEPHNYGLQVTGLDFLFNSTLQLDKHGLQVAIHAIGDKANDLMLDMFESVEKQNGKRDRRFRIEHAQHLAPGSAARFDQLHIIASVQPDHLLDDAESAEKKLGSDRAHRGSYLFQSLLKSGTRLAFGSDWPVADINPLRGIKTARTRIPPGRQEAWIPSQCVSVEDAIQAYTISAAHACFLDDEIGSLSAGKLADFVILSAGPYKDFAEAILSSSVLATYVSGVRVYPQSSQELSG